jgi:O-antigen ligase
MQLLPFIGTTSSNTISYRQRLFDNAWIVIQKNPLFGSTTYLQTPEMESMRQGEGIIDIVNTYLALGLNYGLVGVTLFLLIFLILMFKSYRIMNKLPKEEVDLFRLGRVLISILAAILVTIATVSPIDYIPVFYWVFAALTAAYIYIASQSISEKDTKIVDSNIYT